MTRVVRNAALFCVAGILVASAAVANVPDPAHSTLQGAYIDVAGTLGGLPDNCSDGRCNVYAMTIRDFANNPVAAATVVIDFSGCSDIQISCTQVGPAPGFGQVGLAGKKVAATTNALGQVTFTVDGAALGAPTATTPPTNAPGTLAGVACAQIYANGVPMGGLIVAAFDWNSLGTPPGGVTAVNSSDIVGVANEAARSLASPATAFQRARDDFNHSGTVTSTDASLEALMGAQASLTGSAVTGPYCP